MFSGRTHSVEEDLTHFEWLFRFKASRRASLLVPVVDLVDVSEDNPVLSSHVLRDTLVGHHGHVALNKQAFQFTVTNLKSLSDQLTAVDTLEGDKPELWAQDLQRITSPSRSALSGRIWDRIRRHTEIRLLSLQDKLKKNNNLHLMNSWIALNNELIILPHWLKVLCNVYVFLMW